MKPKTIFTDIDGTLLFQNDFDLMRKFENLNQSDLDWDEVDKLTMPLESVVEKMNKWKEKGHHIVLTTARPENLREFTIAQMIVADIPFDQLVMGIGWGERVLINNLPTHKYEKRATSFEVVKDSHNEFEIIDENI